MRNFSPFRLARRCAWRISVYAKRRSLAVRQPHEFANQETRYTFPAGSFTVLRFE